MPTPPRTPNPSNVDEPPGFGTGRSTQGRIDRFSEQADPTGCPFPAGAQPAVTVGDDNDAAAGVPDAPPVIAQ
jgi:hypothetical protein